MKTQTQVQQQKQYDASSLPAWAQRWYTSRTVAGVSKKTLYNYRWSLNTLNLEIPTASLTAIQARLAECESHYKAETARHLRFVVQEILRDLNRAKDADSLIPLKAPRHRTLRLPRIRPEPKRYEASSLPVWARDWFNGKVASGLSQETLKGYYWTIKGLNVDLKQCSLPEIRSDLANYAEKYKRSTLRYRVQVVKMILADIGRERMAKALKLPRRGEPRVVVYDENDVAEMENSCRLLRDRLLIKIALETGARRGELYNMRIKDVQFDQYSAKIWLHGKTGTRVRRVWRATEDLVSYLREHPEHGNPDAKFWVRHTFHFRNQASGRFTGPKNRPEIHLTSKPLTANSLYRIVRTAGLRSLNRRTFLHGFRHTAATADALKYTDREMMLRFGWSSPAMVGTYAHISARDVDTKELAFHGLRSGGQPNRCCENCKSQNSDAAKFCQNCGRALSGRFS